MATKKNAKARPKATKKTASAKATPKPRKAAKPAKKAAKQAKKAPKPSERPPRRTLRLNRHIYSTQAVKETAEAFGALAEVTVKRDGDYHRVDLVLRDASVAPDTLKLEFANYALGRAAEAR